MSFNLLKEALLQIKLSDKQNTTISILESVVDTKTARRIVESYQVSEPDYKKWLDVICGYAKDEGLKISSKNVFADTAGAVLENDPAPIDQDMQEAIINVLWAKYKAQKQHSKVERVARAQEEEEQLSYALNKMKGCQDEEQPGDTLRARNRNFNTMNSMDAQENEESSGAYTTGFRHGKGGQIRTSRYAQMGRDPGREYERGYKKGQLDNQLNDPFRRKEENEESSSWFYDLGVKHKKSGQKPIPKYAPFDKDSDRVEYDRGYTAGDLDHQQGEENEEPSKAYDIGFTHGVQGKKQVTQYAHFGKAWTAKYNRGFAAGVASGTKSEEDEEASHEPMLDWDEELDDQESAEFANVLNHARDHALPAPPSHLPAFKKKPRNPKYEEEESAFSQLFKQSQSMEDEESDDDFEEDDRGYDDEDFELPNNNKYDNLDDEDYDAIDDDEPTDKRGDRDDYDEDDADLDDETINQGLDMTEDRYKDEDDEYEHRSVGNGTMLSRKSKRPEENEELADRGSQFHKGQLVTCKKTGKQYKVDIPPAGGDYTGVLDTNNSTGRITMVATKDLLPVEQPVEDEEVKSTSKQGSRVSFLNDLLTGSNTAANMKKLQDEIETEAHNAYMNHHAKAPQSPHPKGSIAHKAWMKGFQNAGKSIYAPKVVVDTVKPKAKKKK
ncbi:hypothetical protein M0R04_07280 [Candidatus Dojkabacteria bacterium]|jgi:hypothetical protein|nr:hypothetical protein [Candidatus Dojkabacteria bacterium]